MVALTAVFMVFAVPMVAFAAAVLIVAFALNHRMKKRRLVHDEIQKALEHGASGDDIGKIARALGAADNGKVRGFGQQLVGGIAILAWGIGLGGFFLFLHYWAIAFLLGAPLSLIGIAKIVVAVIANAKKAKEGVA